MKILVKNKNALNLLSLDLYMNFLAFHLQNNSLLVKSLITQFI